MLNNPILLVPHVQEMLFYCEVSLELCFYPVSSFTIFSIPGRSHLAVLFQVRALSKLFYR
jgi:hypothetical protein